MKTKTERKRLHVPPDSLKVIDEEKGIVEHIVAVMGNVDLGKDKVWNGAFAKTIEERGPKVRVLDQHRTDTVMAAIGTPLSIKEIGREALPPILLKEYPEATGALWAKTQFLMDTPEGRGAFVRLKAGAIDEWSFAYDALDYDYEEEEDKGTIRNLRTLRLWEYSPVVFAMNPATTTISAKEDVKEQSLEDLASSIRDAFYVTFERDAIGIYPEEWEYFWVRGVFEDYLVVDITGAPYPLWRVTYSRDEEGVITFAPQGEWTGGNYVFVAGEKTVDNAPAKRAASFDEQSEGAGPTDVSPTSGGEMLMLIELEEAEIEMLEVK